MNGNVKFTKLGYNVGEEAAGETVHEVIFKKAIGVTVDEFNTLVVEEELPRADVGSVELAMMVQEVLRRVGDDSVRLNLGRNHERKHQVKLLAVGEELGDASTKGSDGRGKLLVELGRIRKCVDLNIIELETRARSLGNLFHVDVVFF